METARPTEGVRVGQPRWAVRSGSRIRVAPPGRRGPLGVPSGSVRSPSGDRSGPPVNTKAPAPDFRLRSTSTLRRPDYPPAKNAYLPAIQAGSASAQKQQLCGTRGIPLPGDKGFTVHAHAAHAPANRVNAAAAAASEGCGLPDVGVDLGSRQEQVLEQTTWR